MTALLLSGLLLAAAPPPYVVVLGVAQDAGHPQAATKAAEAWAPERRRRVSCLGLVDPGTGRRWMFDATPDFPAQLWDLDRWAPTEARPGLAGIFVTHAHIGHYTGLMYLGREAIGARDVPVHAMPRMQAFLRKNGPWDQLVRLRNVRLAPLADGRAVALGPKLSVTPFRVPHRDEYSETVGFVIRGPTRAVAYLPDIDKWSAWAKAGGSLVRLLARVDVAYLDGTFYADGEIPGRAMSEIPHPFISETLDRLAKAPAARRKVRFIHLNRTNPALWAGTDARARIEAAGARVAKRGERVDL